MIDLVVHPTVAIRTPVLGIVDFVIKIPFLVQESDFISLGEGRAYSSLSSIRRVTVEWQEILSGKEF